MPRQRSHCLGQLPHPSRLLDRLWPSSRSTGLTRPQPFYTPSAFGEYEPQFSGKVSLEGLRVNQLSLAPRLTGEIEASKEGASINARGRADELLRVELDIPAVDSMQRTGDPTEGPQPSVSVSIRRGLLARTSTHPMDAGSSTSQASAWTTWSLRRSAAASSAERFRWTFVRGTARLPAAAAATERCPRRGSRC